MARRWVRQELQKNELARVITLTINYVIAHKNVFYSTFAMLIVVAAFTVFAAVKIQNAKNKSWESLAGGQSLIYQNKLTEAEEYLKNFISNFPNTAAAAHAAIELSEIKLFYSKLDEAASVLNEGILNNKIKTLTPFLKSKLAGIYFKKGDFENALTIYTEISNSYPDHWMMPSIYKMLALCHTAKNDPQKAREYLDKIVTLYPATEWAESANKELQAQTTAQAVMPDKSKN